MISVPIGPCIQRNATAASPDYLDHHGRPEHPRTCSTRLSSGTLRQRYSDQPLGVRMQGRDHPHRAPRALIVRVGGAADLAVAAALAGTGLITLFEDWLRPHLESGALQAVMEV